MLISLQLIPQFHEEKRITSVGKLKLLLAMKPRRIKGFICHISTKKNAAQGGTLMKRSVFTEALIFPGNLPSENIDA